MKPWKFLWLVLAIGALFGGLAYYLTAQDLVRVGKSVPAPRHLLDLDATPCLEDFFIPTGFHRKMGKDIELERRGDDLYLGGKKIVFHFMPPVDLYQGYIEGRDYLREYLGEVADRVILNANVAEYLIAHPELIPESWKKGDVGRPYHFLGTIFCHPEAAPFVMQLWWHDGRWHSGYVWMSGGCYVPMLAE